MEKESWTKQIKHKIRSAYGFTDKQILEHISEYGESWAIDSYRLIMEDEHRYWQTQLTIVQAARTPMSKKGGKAITKYVKDLRKALEQTFTPWIVAERRAAIRKRLSEPPKPRVIAEGPGPDLDGLKQLAEKSDLEVSEG